MPGLVLSLTAISFALIAWSLQAGQSGSLHAIVAFYVTPSPPVLASVAASAAWVCWAVVALALWGTRCRIAQRVLVGLLLFVSVFALLSLFGTHQYVAASGGFPVLGSGQGVIKFVALLVLAITLWRWQQSSAAERFWLNYLPVGLVLLWIGGMKFFAFEAKGIVALVSTSPLLSWLYSFANEQTASNLIGIYDWLAALLLAAGFRWPRCFIAGFFLSLAVFVTTQSFLVSFQGAWAAPAVLSSSGVFIIKDLWFIANMLLLLQAWRQKIADITAVQR